MDSATSISPQSGLVRLSSLAPPWTWPSPATSQPVCLDATSLVAVWLASFGIDARRRLTFFLQRPA